MTDKEDVVIDNENETKPVDTENQKPDDKNSESVSENSNLLTEEKIREICQGIIGEFMDRVQTAPEKLPDTDNGEKEREPTYKKEDLI